MKSIRLNNDIRHDIAARAIAAQHPELRDAAVATNKKQFAKDYGTKIYNHLYDANTRRRLARAPKGMVPMADHIKVKLIYVTEHIDPRDPKGIRRVMGHECIEVYLGEMRPVFAKHDDCYTRIDEADLGVNGVEMVKAYDMSGHWKVQRRRRRMIRKVMAFLKQFNTTKQLHEAWPEGRKFIPKQVQAATTATAPTIPCDNINRLLNITT